MSFIVAYRLLLFILVYCVLLIKNVARVDTKYWNSLFHMKITARVTKSSHEDCGHAICIYKFFLVHTLSSSAEK